MQPPATGPAARGDIAIVGMACLLPGAPDLDTYWQNIVSRVDAVTDPPPEAWEAGIFYQPDATTNDRVYCKRGGFIGPLTYFDPLAHGVMPRAVDGSEPDQWLALQVARAALADAGYGDEIPERERTAVILGKGTYLNRGNLSVVQHGQVIDQTLEILQALHPEYSAADLGRIRTELKRQLPPFGADSVPGLIPNIIAGRIANRLNLMGPSYTVDAACASSLVAVDLAMRDLLTGQCDLALAGGVHVVTPVPVLMLFCQLNALSRKERIRPFDQDADGTLLGEGLGMLVLKRLEDARRDGQRVYAVIKGVGVASDGQGLSVMAPRREGEVLAMQRAYAMAGLSPRTVGLIEAHGTGTPVGDETELEALAQVFGPGGEALPWCALGSVKSMIGHVMPAAGVAGLIKTALSLYHKVLPPTLNVEAPNPKIAGTPFYLNTETRPWIHAGAAPRRAGVNAFGFGGINAHVILEEDTAPAAADAGRAWRWDTEVCVLAAETRAALVERVERLRSFLQAAPAVDLKDLAYTLNTALTAGPWRLAVVAADPADLGAKLARAAQRLADPACRQIKDASGLYFFEQPLARDGQLAFLFPGEGSQYVGMLADLCLRFPEVRGHFDLIDRVFAGHARRYRPSDLIFPRPAFSAAERQAAEARLWEMEGAVEAVLTANRALAELLSRLEIRPDCVVGHSTGEYSALLAAGMLTLDTEALVGRFSLELNSLYRQSAGAAALASVTLAAVAAPAEQVAALLAEVGGELHVAMDNCPHQTVVLGEAGAMQQALAAFGRQGLIYERLRFDRPYHTPLFSAYAEQLQPFLARWINAPPRIKTYSCTTHAPFTAEVAANQAVIVNHWLKPVGFRQTIAAMHADGVRLFVEVGAGGNLTAFVNDILRGRPHLAVAANVKSRSGLTQLHHLLGLLAAHGTPMRLDYLYQRRAPRKLDLDQPAEAGGKARPSKARMKLATGWPAMRLDPDTAAGLRPKGAAPHPTIPAAAPGQNGHASLPLPPSLPPAMGGAPARSGAPEPAASGQSAPQSAPSAPAAAAAMAAYLRAMDQFLSVQQDVMQAFLGRPAAAASPALPELRSLPVNGGGPPSPTPPPPAPEAADAAPGQEPGAEDLRALLLRLVSERTGYPIEMLDLDLDLEANLGIDSIKRVEILGSLQRRLGLSLGDQIEALSGLKTLRAVLDFLEARGQAGLTAADPSAAADQAPPAALGPLLHSVLHFTPGEAAVTRCEINLDEALYLRDHTLGRPASAADPDLRGLPLLPFTFSLEILAEGAALLKPNQALAAARDVRAYRWIALDGGALALEVAARLSPDGQVQASLREAGAAPGAPPFIEATLVFAEALPEPPPAGEFALTAAGPSRWTPERLYEDGMFHGPAFRGIVAMDEVGEDGATATLAVKPARGLLRSQPDPAFLTDPVLLDQPGQVVGLWTAERLETGYVIFPFALEALHLYAHPPADEQLACRARIALIGEQRVRSDLDIVGPDGRLWARFVGWEDRRFDLSRDFHRLLLAPAEVTLSRPWPALAAHSPGLLVRRLGPADFPKDFFTAYGGLWTRVLAHLVLSRSERALWHALRLPERRRLEWLLGRLAAKDAVRAHVRERLGLTLSPAEVEILPDENGRPMVQGIWTEQLPRAPRVSISHTAGLAVAAVGDSDGVGVDVERLGHLTEAAEAMAFSAEERELLAGLRQDAAAEWPLRLWCAKEAAAKALGRGLAGGPQALTVANVEAAAGLARVVAHGKAQTAFTLRDGDLIAAVVVSADQQESDRA